MNYNICNGVSQWIMSKSINDKCYFYIFYFCQDTTCVHESNTHHAHAHARTHARTSNTCRRINGQTHMYMQYLADYPKKVINLRLV